MYKTMATMVAGIGMLYMIDGIRDAVTKKQNIITNFVKIIYPGYVFIVMLCFIGIGLFK